MRRFVPLLAALVLLTACGPKRAKLAVVADQTTYEAISDIHRFEQQQLCGQDSCADSPVVEHLPGWTKAKSEAFNLRLLPAARAGAEFNRILKDLKPGQPLPEHARLLIQSLSSALVAVINDFPEGPTKAAFLTKVNAALQLAVGSLNNVLTVMGRQ